METPVQSVTNQTTPATDEEFKLEMVDLGSAYTAGKDDTISCLRCYCGSGCLCGSAADSSE